MTATNHVVTGALIAAVIRRPEIALPLAFLSHFALDMIPHFGWKDRSKKFFMILGLDMFLAASVLLAILIIQPAHWLVLIAGGILAASPDLLWLYYLIYELQNRPRPFGRIAKLLGNIQWSETTPGIFIEVGWLLVTGAILVNIVK